MGCKPEKEVESYDFFENIENYIDKVNKAENSSSSDGGYSDCDGFSKAWESSFKDTQIAKNICKELIILYNSLNNLKAKSTRSKDYKDECEFFNYWVNFKISKNMINERDCVEKIYNAFESHCIKDFGVILDADIIYNINKDDLYKMNILYSLYNKYTEIDTILKNTSQVDKQSLLNLSNACCTHYNQASYICNGDNNSTFCTKLKSFDLKYEQLYSKLVGQGYDFSDYFTKLSECPNTKIIATAVTGTVVGLIPLVGVLYKFTPMGQMFISKNGILNKDIRNNDEEMINMSLMEQENEALKFQKGTYNIKYQSL
ncbi:PIR protein [Plasmodium vivax]|uniref:VIR protein n=1 Tax=Plasmodium vivax TaxID=5855 RepID=A0A565A5M1_PLAVI|nr:PIR protein [Plasmodium vivax]VUZ99521.1 PIR protein [Plasmodium vivax]